MMELLVYNEGSAKNPIAVLQEYCQLKHFNAPVYTVVKEEGEPHQKMFTIECYSNDDTTVGQGRSKKEAKLKAAVKMVELFKGVMADGLNVTRKAKANLMIVSDGEEQIRSKINENPIGFLQEYCVARHLPIPNYTEGIHQSGHFVVTCSVGTYTCQGTGRQKKTAKAESSRLVCESILQDLLSEKENPVNVKEEQAEADQITNNNNKQLSEENGGNDDHNTEEKNDKLINKNNNENQLEKGDDSVNDIKVNNEKHVSKEEETLQEKSE